MSGTYTGYGPNQGSIDPSRNGPPGQHNPNQQYSRPGTPPQAYYWPYGQQTSHTPPESVYNYPSTNPEPQSKCTSCIALGCDVFSLRKVTDELTSKLMSKNHEISRHLEEIESYQSKSKMLEKEFNLLKESELNLRKKCLSLEDKCSILEKQCSLLTQEKEEMLTAQQKILDSYSRNPSLAFKVNDKDLTDTLDSSLSEECSSFDRRGNDRRSGNQSRSDSGRNEASVGNQARMKPEYSAGARQGSSSSHGGGAWNNQQVYPNRDSGPRSNPPRNRPEEGMRPIEGAADHSKVSLDNVDGAGNNQQLRRNAGPRPAPQGSRSKDGSWPTQNRPNQGHADHSRNSYGNAEGISAKPNSEYPEVVKVMKKDLFDMPEEYSLAHCVGSDLIMSSGVAVNFRKKFRQVPELLEQNKQPGEVAFLESKGRFIYYLVTKVASTGKPTWDDFERAVIEWSRLCVEHKVTKVAIPKLGCGRDQLDWNRVRDLINRQFSAHEIEVVVCVIDQEAVPEKKWNLKLNHSKEPLSMLDPRDCALVFIASKDHFLTPSIQRLATKYGFTSDYSSGQLGLGSLYQYTNAVTKVAIFGLVVKLKHSDPISFSSVGTCLQHLRRAVKKMKLYYMGFEAFDDPKFPNVTRKLWTAVIDTFFVEEIEVYFCWPNDVKEKNWEERMLH